MDAEAPDLFDSTADEFAIWAKERAGTAGGNPAEAHLLLGLMRDHLGLAEPRDLGPGDLRRLLLDIYPRKVTVLRREDIADTIPTARDLLRFMAETGRARSSAELESELDEIAPGFPDTVMDPAKWGMARSLVQAMASDGVDFSDEGAVNLWIAGHNARQQLGLLADDDPFAGAGDADDDSDIYGDGEFYDGRGIYGGSDAEAGSDADNAAAIKEAFGLPDRLPALRVPGQAELASAARQSGLLAQARALALWADGRELTSGGDLVPADLPAAAASLGIAAPPAGASMDDAPELRHAWHLACCMFFVDNEDSLAGLGDTADEWPDGSDHEVIGVWADALGHECGHSLAIDGSDDELFEDLGLDSAGAGLIMALFLARGEGMHRGECRSLVNEIATADLALGRARKTLAAWSRAYGEMADHLLDRLSRLGAVETDGEMARLTSLARWQMREELTGTVEIPLLPPLAEMTATDLVAFGTEAPADELETERQAWLALRPAVQAARELLSVAADGGPAERMMGTSLATAVGAAAEPLWREVLDDPALGAYAKVALNEIAGHDPAADPLPGLEIEPGDAASMLSDTLMAMSGAIDGRELAEMLRQAVPPGHEEQVFEVMWRSANPDAGRSLELLGRHHPDKKIAKAARKAAFRARSQPGPRS